MTKPISVRLKSVELALLEKLASESGESKTECIHAGILLLAQQYFTKEQIANIMLENRFK